MNKPKLLDLFCGAGGAAKGYMDAGFYVVGVDSELQPHYVGDKFYQADALNYPLDGFEIIHASPVCKGYTHCNRPNMRSALTRDDYPRLVSAVRSRRVATGRPYIIENVVGAKSDLRASLLLCASMFGLPMQRHRLFEIGGTDLFIMPPGPCQHKGATIQVYGHSIWDSAKEGTPRKDGRKRPDSVPVEIGHAAMGIDWMSKAELAQAIPPAYTSWIGRALLSGLESEESR